MPSTPSAPSTDRGPSPPGGGDLITPMDLRPAAQATNEPGFPADKSQWLNVLILVAIVMVIVLAGALLYLYINRNLGDPKVIAPGIPTVQSPQSEPLEAETESPPEVVPAAPPALAETSPVPQAHGQIPAEEQNAAVAHTDYQKALELDSDSAEARNRPARVAAENKTEQFNRLMAAGLNALNRSDYQTARVKLQQAQALLPTASAVADALARLDQAVRSAEINRLMQPARTAEENEDWPGALAYYQKILKLDPHIGFARQGQARAREQIRFAKRIAFFLEQPHTLTSDTQLQNALALVDEVQGVAHPGSGLSARLQRLKTLIHGYQTPVKVTLESDNHTDVAVYRVGRLGRFAVHELDLRPGTYTVLGSRDGYRDFRQKITLSPGQMPVKVAVACTEKI